MKANLKLLAIFYGAAFAVQTAGNYFTMQSVSTWYPTLEKSVLTPPGYVFGIVWTLLYILMSIAAWRVARVQQQGLFSHALKPWWLQLVLGLLWSIVFFGLRNPEFGLIIIILTAITILATIARFLCIERMAGYCLLPLGLWVCFATYLNAVIVWNN